MEESGIGGMAGGHMHFQAGLGFFPSLFGLQFVSAKACLYNGVSGREAIIVGETYTPCP